jgi:toxin ParE1/3/4
MKLIWSPLALERVSEIGEYIARDKPIAARNWIENVFAKVEQLKDSPEIGRVVPEIGKIEFRELLYSTIKFFPAMRQKLEFRRFLPRMAWIPGLRYATPGMTELVGRL